MNTPVVRTEGLSKRYRIGRREAYGSLREVLSDRVLGTAGGVAARLAGRARAEVRASDATFWALRDVSFEVHRGEVVGVIGRNGAGKTTLLKILGRITDPTSGRAEVRGPVGSLIEVTTGLHPELTGRENIYLMGAILGLRRADVQRRFEEIVIFSGVSEFLETPVKRYSTGMRMRLAFSVAAHLEPNIFLVDEILAVGDAVFQEKSHGQMQRVARGGSTVFFVSHNMAIIRALCTRVLLLEEGRVAADGSPEEVIGRYLSGIQTEIAPFPHRDEGRMRRVAVTSFAARAAGTAADLPRTCEDTQLIVGYEAAEQRSLLRLRVIVTLVDSIGTNLFSVSTGMRRQDFQDIPHIGSVVCRIDRLPLAPGRYSVNVTLVDDQGRADQVLGVAAFNVIDGGASGMTMFPRADWGAVIVPQEWTWAPLDTAQPEAQAPTGTARA